MNVLLWIQGEAMYVFCFISLGLRWTQYLICENVCLKGPYGIYIAVLVYTTYDKSNAVEAEEWWWVRRSGRHSHIDLYK